MEILEIIKNGKYLEVVRNGYKLSKIKVENKNEAEKLSKSIEKNWRSENYKVINKV